MNNLYQSMRDVDMSDLRQLLSDIEAIEAEQKAAGILSQDEEQRYGESKRASMSLMLQMSQKKLDMRYEQLEKERRESLVTQRVGSVQSQAINHYLGHPERRRSESASTWLAPTPGVDNYDAGIGS